MDIITDNDLILLEQLNSKKDIRNFIFCRYFNCEPAKICNEYIAKYKSSKILTGKMPDNYRVAKVDKVPDVLPECINEIVPNPTIKPLYNYTKEWVKSTNIIAPIKKTDDVDKAEKLPEDAIKNNYMIDIYEGIYTITINTSLKIELDNNSKRFILTDETAVKNKVIMDIEI